MSEALGKTATFDRFVSLWTHPEYPPSPVKASELDMVEQRFSFQLPRSYKEDVLRVGLPQTTIALLNVICDGQLDLSDINDFLRPAQIVEKTEAWHEIGFPRDLVAFATDCMGNLFAFSRSVQGESGVWFFDHDFNEVSEVSDDFRSWIEDYCNIKPSPDREAS
jgi:hypothetical protein